MIRDGIGVTKNGRPVERYWDDSKNQWRYRYTDIPQPIKKKILKRKKH